jgi:hypothetical protein
MKSPASPSTKRSTALLAPTAAVISAALSLPVLATTAFLILLPFLMAGLGSGSWFPLPSAANQALGLAAVYGFVALFIAYWACIAALTYQLGRRRKLSRGTLLFCLAFALAFLAALYPWRFSNGTHYFHALAWPHVGYLICLSVLAFRARTDA